MNKKGFYGFVSIFIWFFILVVAIGVAIGQNGNFSKEMFTNTTNNLVWKPMSVPSNNTIVVITYKFVNFFGDSAFLLSKEAITFGYNHPEWNAKTLIIIVLLSILAPLIYPAFIIIVSLILITKEYFVSRRERRKLRELSFKRRQHDFI